MDRATVFGSIAEHYDRHRPKYPNAMWDDLFSYADLTRATVLEVGCGTGLATAELAQHEFDITAIDADPRMLEVARRRRLPGVTFIPKRFEEHHGGAYDLIFAGSSWHWVDPDRGPAHAASLLNPGGVLAVAWNIPTLSDLPFADALSAVYEEMAPDMAKSPSLMWHKDQSHHRARIADSGLFDDPMSYTHTWAKPVTPDEYTAIVSTHSDHLILGENRLEELLPRIHAVVADHGDLVDFPYRTVMYLARLNHSPSPAGV
jgi:SAM-dependent methyltransferase